MISSANAESLFDCSNQIPNAKNLLRTVATKFNSIPSIKADFEQSSLLLGFNQTASSKGKLVFKKVGMMDWHYILKQEIKKNIVLAIMRYISW